MSEINKLVDKYSRIELDAMAMELGLTPREYANKTEIASAIIAQQNIEEESSVSDEVSEVVEEPVEPTDEEIETAKQPEPSPQDIVEEPEDDGLVTIRVIIGSLRYNNVSYVKGSLIKVPQDMLTWIDSGAFELVE